MTIFLSIILLCLILFIYSIVVDNKEQIKIDKAVAEAEEAKERALKLAEKAKAVAEAEELLERAIQQEEINKEDKEP